MGVAIDLTGKRFGRLLVIEFSERDPASNKKKWMCQCDCGNAKVVPGSSLTASRTKSCGCGVGISTAKRLTTHGMSRGKTYASWGSMIQRCTNPNNPRYHDYGGRGITICGAWMVFSGFYSDMGKRPGGRSIERRDNERGYSPDNCYWATRNQQQRNMRMPKTNTSGILGVSFRAGRYEARIRAGGKGVYLGRFKTIEEATEARRIGEITYWNKERHP